MSKETRILLVSPIHRDIPDLYLGIAQELDKIAKYPHGKDELPKFIKNMMSRESFIENFCGKLMFYIYEQDFLPLFYHTGMQVIERDYAVIEQHSITDCGFDALGGLGHWLRNRLELDPSLGKTYHLADMQRFFFAEKDDIHYVVLIGEGNAQTSVKELFVEDSIPFIYADLCYGAEHMETLLEYDQKALEKVLSKFVGYTVSHIYRESKSTLRTIFKPYSWHYLKQQLNVYFGAGWAESLIKNPLALSRISLNDLEQLKETDLVSPLMHSTICQAIAQHKKDIEKHGLIAG